MSLLAPARRPVAARVRAPRSAPVRGHLHQIDVVRVLTFACVVAVHANGETNSGSSVAAGLAGDLLHFTREVFFLITGFVLFHSYYHRPLAVAPFYRRRLLLVGVPYAVWTVFYVSVGMGDGLTGSWPHQLAYALVSGRGCYHLYFLLVSLQTYLLLPVLLWVVRRTAGFHRWLLAGALAVELAEMAALHRVGPLTGLSRVLVDHAESFLPTYLLYLTVGALAAVHLPACQRVVDRFRPWVVLVLAGGAAAMVAAYLAEEHNGGIGYAGAVFQPILVLWSLVVGLAFYALGSAWAARGPRGRPAAALATASQVSFGVYLVHPWVLSRVGNHLFGAGHSLVSPPWSTLLDIGLTIAISSAVVLAVQRTPLSLVLTGQPRSGAPRTARGAGRPASTPGS